MLTLDILAKKLRSIGVYGGNAEKLLPLLSKYLYTSLPPSRSQVVSLKHLAENFPELNMANYNPDDVEELNNWGIEIANCAEELAQADARDAARYRFLRDTCWSSDKELATVISLQMNKVWDEKIDEAMARNKKE